MQKLTPALSPFGKAKMGDPLGAGRRGRNRRTFFSSLLRGSLQAVAQRISLTSPKFQRLQQGNPLCVRVIDVFTLQGYWVQCVLA